MNGRLWCTIGLTLSVMASPCGGQSRWTVDEKPIATYTLPDSAKGGMVAGATRLRNGSVAIADSRNGRVVFFDGGGGRTGIGNIPARSATDVGLPIWIGACGGDSVFAWDGLGNELVVLDVKGAAVRRTKPPSEGQLTARCGIGGAMAYLSVPRVTPQGRAAMTPGAAFMVLPTATTVLLSNTAGDKLGTVPGVASGDLITGRLANGRPGGASRPLGKHVSVAVLDGAVAIAEPDSNRVRIHRNDGRLAAMIGVAPSSQRPLREAYERAVDIAVATLPTTQHDLIRDLLLDVPLPADVTPISNIHSDGDGVLWLELSSPGDRETLLRGYRASGQLLSEIRMSTNLVVLEIGHDYLLARASGKSQTTSVALYRLARPKNP